MSFWVLFMCLLGKMCFIVFCCVFICVYLQSFDVVFYFQMNEKKFMWICFVCDKKVFYEFFIIDGLFMEIFSFCLDCDEI